jgi:hypothetical protein
MSKAKVIKRGQGNYEEPSVNECEECNECECCERELGPLTRHFATYEGFQYIFKYGASQEYCGNEEQKYSVLMIPRWGDEGGAPQCICVKRPMVTGSELEDRCFIDLEIGLSNFPLETLLGFTEESDRECCTFATRTRFEYFIDTCLNIYRKELGKLDIGYAVPMDTMNVSISEPVSYNWGNIHLDKEGRLIVTIMVPWNDTLANDNILFVSLGMEFIRQIMSAANTYILLSKTSTFKPDFVEVFARNIRHEIANGYYPDGFEEVIKFVAISHGCEGIGCELDLNDDE